MSVLLTRPRAAARTAGLGYVAIFVLAFFADFLAVGGVLDPNDAQGTADALARHEATFRLGTVAFLAIFLIDIAVAWALYVLFRDVRRDLALLSAWFRLAYTVILGASLVFLYLALRLVDGPLPGTTPGVRDTQVLLALQAFDFAWVAGLAAFGVHLVLLGRLLVTADHAPRLVGRLLVLAGAAYVMDTVAHIVLSDYQRYADLFLALVAIPSVVGELSLTVWLLLVAAGRRPAPSRHEGPGTEVSPRPTTRTPAASAR